MDGREIINSTAVMSLEFSHGWVEEGRIFRVEVNASSDTYDFAYIFSIDGVRFDQMPNSPVTVTGTGESAAPVPSRSKEKKTPTVSIKKASSGSSATFDPFSEQSPAPTPAAVSKTPAANAARAVKTAAPAAPVVDLFEAPVTAHGDAFGSFGQSDPFAAKSTASDPFAVASKQASSSDPFSSSEKSDPFGSTAPAPFDAFAAPVVSKPVATSAPAFDPFSAPALPKPAAFDAFGSDSFAPKPQYSSQGISNDLAGLRFDAPVVAPPVATLPHPVQEPVAAPSPAKRSSGSELWDTGLISLDLSGKPAPTRQSLVSSGAPIGSFVKTAVDAKPVMMQPPQALRPHGQPGFGAPGGMAPPVNNPAATFAFAGLQGGYQPQTLQQKPKDPFDFRGLH